MSEKLDCRVRYRHIGPDDYHTPMMYLPMQETVIPVEPPVTHDSVVDAIMTAIGDDLGLRREHIHDVEFWEERAT